MSLSRRTVLSTASVGIATVAAANAQTPNAPAGTPPAVIERHNADARRAFVLAEVKAQLAAQGIETVPGTAEAFAAFYRQETAKWAKIIKDSGAKID